MNDKQMIVTINLAMRDNQRGKWCSAELLEQIRLIIGPDFNSVVHSVNISIDEPETGDYSAHHARSSHWIG